jgi:photosystem II stability/assembly factor-like uncharacterized protein
MKKLLTLAMVLILAACSESTPTTPEVSPSADKKGSSSTTTYTVVNVPATNWNITSDTSICGTLILRWTNQNRPTGASNYLFTATPVTANCAGGLNTTTNILYYTYGWGCTFWPGKTYSVVIKYNWKDDVNKKIFIYSSTPISVTTGRGTWDCN